MLKEYANLGHFVNGALSFFGIIPSHMWHSEERLWDGVPTNVARSPAYAGRGQNPEQPGVCRDAEGVARDHASAVATALFSRG